MYISLSDGGSSASDNTVTIQFRNNGTIRLYAQGTSTIVAIASDSYDLTQFNKIAVGYKENDWSLYINGDEITNATNIIPAVSNLSSLDLSLWYSASSPFNGKVKQLQVYKTTDIDLAALTS